MPWSQDGFFCGLWSSHHHWGFPTNIIYSRIYHLVMTFTVRHGKKITIFQFGKASISSLGHLSHGEMLVITRLGKSLGNWIDEHPPGPWHIAPEVLTVTPGRGFLGFLREINHPGTWATSIYRETASNTLDIYIYTYYLTMVYKPTYNILYPLVI